MVKMSPGYDPEYADWWYGMYDAAGKDAIMQGKVPGCIFCHRQAADTDYLFSKEVGHAETERAETKEVTIRIVRLGSPRADGEGLRIGTVRRPPRGVRKEDYASKNIYDVWFPNLSPSEALLKEFFPAKDEKSWRVFTRKFLAEMKSPEARRNLDLLAALSHQTDFAIGCYCEVESRCHRSILRELLEKSGAKLGRAG